MQFTDESLPTPRQELQAVMAKVAEAFGVSANEAQERLVAAGLMVTAGRARETGPVRCQLLRVPPELRALSGMQHK
jgi:hypothetical protein